MPNYWLAAPTVDALQLGDAPLGFIGGEYPSWALKEDQWAKHLDALIAAGCTFYRLLPWGIWGDVKHRGQVLTPYRYRPDKDGWDLDSPNTSYWWIAKRMIEMATVERGLWVLVDLTDNCVNKNAKYAPFDIYDAENLSRVEDWVQQAVATFAGPKVHFGMGNELSSDGTKVWAKLIDNLRGTPILTTGSTYKAKDGDDQACLQQWNLTRFAFGRAKASWQALVAHQCAGADSDNFRAIVDKYLRRYRLYLANDGMGCTAEMFVDMVQYVKGKLGGKIDPLTTLWEWIPDVDAGDPLPGVKRIAEALA